MSYRFWNLIRILATRVARYSNNKQLKIDISTGMTYKNDKYLSGNTKNNIPSYRNTPPPPPKIPGTRYKVGSKDEYTVYDGDEKKYYKNKKENQ